MKHLTVNGSCCMDSRTGQWSPPRSPQEARARLYRIASQTFYAKCKVCRTFRHVTLDERSTTYFCPEHKPP